MLQTEILEYYNELAPEYDKSRFSNSYGKFIHDQEHKILDKILGTGNHENLDLACGTGRLLDFAKHGIDLSPEMIKISTDRHPSKIIQTASADQLPYSNSFFENVFSFHLFMHLELSDLEKILKEVHRVTKEDGLFIFDIPSRKRRTLTGYKTTSWHGATDLDTKSLKAIIGPQWEIASITGVAFLPVHKIPKGVRKYLVKLDNMLCRSFLKKWSSYLVFVLRKK